VAWTLSGLDLGFVNKEQVTKDSGLILLPIPKTDAADLLAFDFTGVTGTIVISGTKTATLADAKLELQQFVFAGSANNPPNNTAMKPAGDSLFGLIAGQQDAPLTYVSEFYGTCTVKINTLDVSLVEGNPYSFIKYDITFTICGT